MKFKELLAEVSGEVAEYRRDIFNTIILGLIIGIRRKEYTDKSINFNGVCSKTLKRAGNIILNSFFREVA